MTRDNRQSEREDIRTAAEGILLSPTAKRIKIWTDDISATGAKVLTREEIPGDEFYIRFLLAGHDQNLIAAQVVRRQRDDFRNLHEYAVRFLRICKPDEIDEVQSQLESLTTKSAD